MIANSRRKLCFADFFGQPSFLKEQCIKMMPQPLQSHPSVGGFYTIYAAFHLLKFRQEETTGNHDVKLLSILSYYNYCFRFLNVNVQIIKCVCSYLYCLNNIFKIPTQPFYIASSQNTIVKEGDWRLFLWLVFHFKVGLLWSFHLWYTVLGNTCYIFSDSISLALLQSSC